MKTTEQIPKILIYEEFDGRPIYQKGYKDSVLGLKKIEEINMGTSQLQYLITRSTVKHLARELPDGYAAGSS